MLYFYLQIRVILQVKTHALSEVACLSYQLNDKCQACSPLLRLQKVVTHIFQIDAVEFCTEPFTNQYQCLLSWSPMN